MRRRTAVLVMTLVLLIFVDAWIVSAIATGLVRGEGEGAVFTAAVALLAAIAALTTYLAYRVARKLFVSR